MEAIRPKFRYGQIVATAAAAELLSEAQIGEMLTRHLSGDWGDLDDSDKQMNESALKSGERLLSRYIVNGEPFYVITEWDRSVTTVLRSQDY
jgi:hypothetical protein